MPSGLGATGRHAHKENTQNPAKSFNYFPARRKSLVLGYWATRPQVAPGNHGSCPNQVGTARCAVRDAFSGATGEVVEFVRWA
jgi:hypothetical protein